MLILPGRTASWNVAAPGFTDDFNRANEVISASADWTKYASTAQAEADIVSEQAVMSSTASGQTLTYHSSYTDAGDCYVQADFVSDMSGGGAFRFHIEDVTSTYGYWYYFQNQSGNWRIIIYRTGVGLSGTGAVSLTGNVDTGIALGATTLRAERIITDGSTVTVKAYIDGVERASTTDTDANRVDGTATTGFGMFSGTTDYTFDNFAAGPV